MWERNLRFVITHTQPSYGKNEWYSGLSGRICLFYYTAIAAVVLRTLALSVRLRLYFLLFFYLKPEI